MSLGLAVTTAIAVAGCGGGGDSGTSTTAAGAVSSVAAKECLNKAGIEVTTEASGEEGVYAVYYINVDTFKQVYLAFTQSPEVAARVEQRVATLAELAGGNAAAERVGETIVLGRAKRTTEDEVNRVKDCLTN